VEFREESKVNILYITSIDQARSKEEILETWNIKDDIFDSTLVSSDITRLVQNRIIKKKEGKYKANFRSQAFIDELKVFLEQNKFDALLEIKDSYLKFIRKSEVQKTLFAPSEIKKYYDSNVEEAYQNPMYILSELAEILFIMSNSTEKEYDLEDQDYDKNLLENTKNVFPLFKELSSD